VRQGRAEAFHIEEARLRAIDGQSSRWLWVAKIYVLGWREESDVQRESQSDGLWLMVVADNPVCAPVGRPPLDVRSMQIYLGIYWAAQLFLSLPSSISYTSRSFS
jgi:hypothetical protein